ncbi:MAG TPA: biotin-dependent carboxyltransferase family protein [Xanthobacteraceae bacterium]|nr:biotin-dependent carboxyltransferase family protein [Xanthobacteraceae bacterium]
MSPALRIIAPGLLTTVQDFGRPGYQHLGIPVSGALDPFSFCAANVLAGNEPGTAALEAAYRGPTFAVEADSVRLAFVGGKVTIEILPDAAASAGTLIGPMESVCLGHGAVVRIGSLWDSAVLYIAVEGGFDLPPVLGSRATYLRGGLGGWHGRALLAGDRLPLVRNRATERDEFRLAGVDLGTPARFRVVLGPQHDYFSDSAIADFFAGAYTVAAGSDRMGMRLDGPPIRHARGYDITSDAIAPGSIQVPGNGKPIVLLADRQTTGGYPKLATVISADLPALGRLPIGAKVAFEPVSIEEAVEARRTMLQQMRTLPTKLVPLTLSDTMIAARLQDANLISGIVDAHSEAA